MRTIDVMVIGALSLLGALVAERYLTTECTTTETYIARLSQVEARTYETIKTGKCYLMNNEKTNE